MKIEKLNESLNEDVKVCYETDLTDFKFWSGAQRTASVLTDKELSMISDMLYEMNPDGMTETEINDIFWFEDDWIAEMLGYDDFETLYDERTGNVEESLTEDQEQEVASYKIDSRETARIVKGSNGKFETRYCVGDDVASRAGTFNSQEEAEAALKKHRPNAQKLEEDALVESFSTEERAQALADYLGIDPSEVENSYDEFSFDTPEGEYYVATEAEAHGLAIEDIKNIFDDIGIDSFTPNFREWIYNNAVDSDWFEGALREYQEFYVEDIEYEDGRLEEELLDAGIITEDQVQSGYDVEDAKEAYVDYLVKNAGDPIEHFKDNFGQESFSNTVKQYDLIDIDAVAEQCIEWDGIAHFIARYDGEEIELANGLFAYRTN